MTPLLFPESRQLPGSSGRICRGCGAVAAACVALAAAVTGLVGGAPAARARQGSAIEPAAARVFTLMGGGGRELADGTIATESNAIPERLAATPDGGFIAVVDERVWRFTLDGRAHPVAAGGRKIADVAVGPDGASYLLDYGGKAILRVDAEGRQSLFAGGPQSASECRSGSEGGHALDAPICAVRIAMSARGLLLLERNPTTVRRIGPDGIITRVAGDGGTGVPAEGAPATASHLDAGREDDIAAMPDGSPAILTPSGIWTVTTDARMHRRLRIGRTGAWYRALAPLSADTLLTGGFRFGLLGTGGLSWLTASPSCCGLWSAFDGVAGPLSGATWTQPLDIAVDADGGWLIADVGRMRYVPPPAPRRLAVGIARPTVSSRLPITATVETTRPARITVAVRVRGRRVGAATVERPAGRWAVAVRGGHTGALNVVTVSAASTDAQPQIATDRIGVLPGATLPMAVVRRLADAGAEGTREIGGGNPTMTCRRIDGRRVDCADEDGGLCQRITAYRLRPDGILTGRDYSEDATHCRFQPHPRWQDASPYGVALPTD